MLIFVYGSLKKGFYNHRLISNFNKIGEGTVKGTMYDLGSFPALCLEPDKYLIKGEIYDVNTVEGLMALDRLEGYNPNNANSFYDRVKVNCQMDDGTTREVSVYVQKPNSYFLRVSKIVESGVWTKRI